MDPARRGQLRRCRRHEVLHARDDLAHQVDLARVAACDPQRTCYRRVDDEPRLHHADVLVMTVVDVSTAVLLDDVLHARRRHLHEVMRMLAELDDPSVARRVIGAKLGFDQHVERLDSRLRERFVHWHPSLLIP